MRFPLGQRCASLICSGVLLFCSAAGAAEPYQLTYHAPAGCPKESELREAVSSYVHDSSRAEGARVKLRVVTLGRGFKGVLVAIDDEGVARRRRVEGKTCAEVVQALAFLAGLAIELGGHLDAAELVDSEADSEADPPVGSAGSEGAVSSPSAADSSTPPVETPPPRAQVGWSVWLGPEVRGGLAPAPRGGGQIAVELYDPSEGLFAPSGALEFLVGASRFPVPGGEAQLILFALRAEACPIRLGVRFSVRPCVGGELGLIRARGEVPVNPLEVIQPWAAADLAVHLRYGGERFFVDLGGGPMFPFTQIRYVFTPDVVAYVVPAVTARGSLTAGVHF